METMQPTLRNGRNVWDAVNMPEGEFQRRIRALRSEMADRRIDVLLAYGDAFNDYGNPCYLSNFVIRLPKGTLVALTRDDATLFFEGASRGLPSAKKLTWIEDVRPCPDVARECINYLKEKGLASSKVGLAGLQEWMPCSQWRSLQAGLQECTTEDVHALLKDMRMIKSEREVDQIRRASRIVKGIFERIGDLPLPDLRERSLEALLIREGRLEGAEDVRVLLGRPRQEGWALRPACEDSLQKGEGVIVHLALVYERYWSEAVRTLSVGGQTMTFPDLQRYEAFHGELVKRFLPGRHLAECCRDAVAGVKSLGADLIGDYGLGEGIGLSPQEGPVLGESAEGTLEEGMCLTLRVCMRDKAMGAVMIGDTMAVTGTGAVFLTR